MNFVGKKEEVLVYSRKEYMHNYTQKHKERLRVLADLNRKKGGRERELNSIGYIYRVTRARAKDKNMDFVFSNIKEFSDFYYGQPQKCHYCGIPKDKIHITHSQCYSISMRHCNRFSLDRKDNIKGYSKENCVLSCLRCNNIKSNVFSYEEFLEIATKYLKPKWEKLC